jgi:uncharacterized membrane protein
MASGAWGGAGRTPSHPSAWSKVYLGWITPTTVSNYVEGRTLKYVEGAEGEVLKLPTTDSKQYFLLENRLATAYDRYLPASGLLIWHIDQTVINQWMVYNRVNNDEHHKGVDLEEASEEQHLDRRVGGNDGDSSDPWRSTTEGFNKDSSPDSSLYDGTITKISVFNISAAGETMTIDIDFGGDSYEVFLDTLSPIMEAAPGEKVTYNITVGTRSALGDTIDLSVTGTHSAWGHLSTTYQTLNLGPKGYALVKLEVTPPPGTPKDIQGQVILRAVSRTVPGVPFSLETFTIVKQLHMLEATPASKTVYVEPGTTKHLDILLSNHGNGRENLTLSLDADRGYWGSITPTEVSVDVGNSINVRVTFDLPQGVQAGEEEPFDLVVFSEVIGGGFEGGETTSLVPTMHIPLQMVVAEVVSLRWGNVQDANVMPGESLHYELTLYNEGNSNSSVLVGSQAPDGWTLDVENGESFILPAFGARTFNATLTAPDDVLAGTDVRLDLSAAVGADFFYTQMRVTVDQMYAVSVDGQEAKFADPGERATFNLTVTNLGNGNDRVTIEVEANGGLWAISTDQNFVDLGTRVDARTAEVHVYVTAPATTEAFEEKTLTVDLLSENGVLTASHEVTLTVNPISDFEVDIEVLSDIIDLTNTAMRKATYLVHVKNTGNQEDLFHIGLIDLPEGWSSTFESRMVSVPANKRKTVQFTIEPPSGDAPVLAGTFGFDVHVASEMGNGVAYRSTLTVTVEANRGHAISSLEPSYQAVSGSKLTFRVLVVNEGNVPETLTLSAVGSFESVAFESQEIALQPFGQGVVNVTVEMSSTKEDTTVDLQVIATTKDLTKQVHTKVPVEVEGRSGVPGPTATAALLALAAVAAVSVASTRRGRRQG